MTWPDGKLPVDQQKLIGVELTYISPTGTSQEIKMFAVDDIYLPREYYNSARMRITLHLSGGDKQVEAFL